MLWQLFKYSRKNILKRIREKLRSLLAKISDAPWDGFNGIDINYNWWSIKDLQRDIYRIINNIESEIEGEK